MSQPTHFIHAFSVAFEVKSEFADSETVLARDIHAVADALIERANQLRNNPQEMMASMDLMDEPVPCDAQGRRE